MLDTQTSTPVRSPRRRTFPVTVAAGLAVLVTVGFATLTPTIAARAATDLVSMASGSSSGPETVRDITADAEAALGTARAALRDAASVAADIAATELELGPEDTDVDTSALRAAIDRLSELDIVPLLLLPTLADDAVAQTRNVSDRVTELRERLDTAQAEKDAADAAAAAAAAAEAERQAAEAAAAAAAQAAAAANTVEGAQATARQLASANYGWGGDQFSCLVSLWTKESGWNYQAYNASSGATGIPQALPGSKMAIAGADWQTNATTQIVWGLKYISAAYGTPCSAWGHSQATNWY